MKRFLLICCAGLCALLLAACGKPAPKFNSIDVSGADWGRDFHLHDAAGQPRSLADFKGKVVMLFFGYTQCPDVCPTTLSTAAAAMKLLGKDADRVQVIFVTLDPARDTPQVMAKYAPAFDPRFIGLLGNAEETAATAKEFKVFYQKIPGATPGSYTLDHTAASYVFDPQGRLRLYVKYGETPEQIASDLRQLLQEK